MIFRSIMLSLPCVADYCCSYGKIKIKMWSISIERAYLLGYNNLYIRRQKKLHETPITGGPVSIASPPVAPPGCTAVMEGHRRLWAGHSLRPRRFLFGLGAELREISPWHRRMFRQMMLSWSSCKSANKDRKRIYFGNALYRPQLIFREDELSVWIRW